jgi:hypothetical protein
VPDFSSQAEAVEYAKGLAQTLASTGERVPANGRASICATRTANA